MTWIFTVVVYIILITVVVYIILIAVVSFTGIYYIKYFDDELPFKMKENIYEKFCDDYLSIKDRITSESLDSVMSDNTYYYMSSMKNNEFDQLSVRNQMRVLPDYV